MFLYVIAYDVPDDKRRKKVADLLEGYGHRVQYSVFECQLSTQQYRDLHSRLKKIIKLQEDNIRFYPLSKHTIPQIEAWGVGVPIVQLPNSIII